MGEGFFLASCSMGKFCRGSILKMCDTKLKKWSILLHLNLSGLDTDTLCLVGVLHLLEIEREILWSDDLRIFKCFRVIFGLKKKAIQFSLSFNLYFQQKRVPKLLICRLLTKRSVWAFDVTNRINGFSNFQSYHQVVMYLLNLLAKSFTLFWKYS